jgi:hypothetical protein
LYFSSSVSIGALGCGALVDEPQTLPQQISVGAEFGVQHVGHRYQVRSEELSERRGIDGIGLHLGVGDRLALFGVGQHEVDSLLIKELGQPVPARGGLHHGSVGARPGLKVMQDIRAAGRETSLGQEEPLVIHRADTRDCLCRSMP